MFHRFIQTVAVLTVVTAFGAAAVAQDKNEDKTPKFPATGVYNCAVKMMNRCRLDRCETRLPRRPMEISIDFEKNEACMRRGSGDCRKPRAFTVTEKGSGHDLYFAKDAMLLHLNRRGRLFGADIGRSNAVTIVAQCARG